MCTYVCVGVCVRAHVVLVHCVCVCTCTYVRVCVGGGGGEGGTCARSTRTCICTHTVLLHCRGMQDTVGDSRT